VKIESAVPQIAAEQWWCCSFEFESSFVLPNRRERRCRAALQAEGPDINNASEQALSGQQGVLPTWGSLTAIATAIGYLGDI